MVGPLYLEAQNNFLRILQNQILVVMIIMILMVILTIVMTHWTSWDYLLKLFFKMSWVEWALMQYSLSVMDAWMSDGSVCKYWRLQKSWMSVQRPNYSHAYCSHAGGGKGDGLMPILFLLNSCSGVFLLFKLTTLLYIKLFYFQSPINWYEEYLYSHGLPVLIFIWLVGLLSWAE